MSLIKNLTLNKYPIFWIIFHILLGISATFSPYPLIVWFYLVLLTSISYFFEQKGSPYALIAIFLYLTGFELLARMAKTFPYIPYELGKYLLFAGMVWIILRFKTFGKLGWLMLLCILPALFFDISGQVVMSDLIFNIFGAVNVALVIIVFYKQKVSVRLFATLIRLLLYSIIAVLSYTVIKSPNFDEVQFALGASVDWSGGFGSNQVSTLFGLGSLLTFILLINRWTFSGYLIVDAMLLFAFSFQGLLTFSRGGMLGAVLGICIILTFLRTASFSVRKKYNLPKIGKYVIPAIIVAGMAYYVVDEMTDGLLSLRYQGETAGTLQGSKTKSLNTVTTGRLEIFVGDVDLWVDNFFFGVGAGASRFVRETMPGTVAHVELSRLLAEHGVLGFCYFLILCFIGWKLLKGQPNPMIKGVLIAFYVVAIYTTFHAAMRTFVTPTLIGLSLLSVQLPKKKNTAVHKSPKEENVLISLKPLK